MLLNFLVNSDFQLGEIRLDTCMIKEKNEMHSSNISVWKTACRLKTERISGIITMLLSVGCWLISF